MPVRTSASLKVRSLFCFIQKYLGGTHVIFFSPWYLKCPVLQKPCAMCLCHLPFFGKAASRAEHWLLSGLDYCFIANIWWGHRHRKANVIERPISWRWPFSWRMLAHCNTGGSQNPAHVYSWRTEVKQLYYDLAYRHKWCWRRRFTMYARKGSKKAVFIRNDNQQSGTEFTL